MPGSPAVLRAVEGAWLCACIDHAPLPDSFSSADGYRHKLRGVNALPHLTPGATSISTRPQPLPEGAAIKPLRLEGVCGEALRGQAFEEALDLPGSLLLLKKE